VLNIFRNYNPYSVIVLFLLAIFLKLATIIHPEAVFVASQSEVLWLKLGAFLQTILGNSPFLITFFAVCNLFGQGIFLNAIANRHHLFPKSNYLPALTYILVTSLFKDWNFLSAALVGNWLLLFMLSSMLKLYATTDGGKQIFNIGCCISLTAMLIFPSIFFIALLLLALAILRPFKAAEWMVGLLGILTPFYFLAGILFLTGDLHLLKKMVTIGFSLPSKMDHPAVTLTAFSMLMVMMVTGMYYLNIFMSRMLFQNKKWWWVIIACFLISLITGTFTVANGYNQWLAILIPGSFIIANAWFEERKKWVSTVLFYLFLAVVIFAQWM
jgi:hypothetical protein